MSTPGITVNNKTSFGPCNWVCCGGKPVESPKPTPPVAVATTTAATTSSPKDLAIHTAQPPRIATPKAAVPVTEPIKESAPVLPPVDTAVATSTADVPPPLIHSATDGSLAATADAAEATTNDISNSTVLVNPTPTVIEAGVPVEASPVVDVPLTATPNNTPAVATEEVALPTTEQAIVLETAAPVTAPVVEATLVFPDANGNVPQPAPVPVEATPVIEATATVPMEAAAATAPVEAAPVDPAQITVEPTGNTETTGLLQQYFAAPAATNG